MGTHHDTEVTSLLIEYLETIVRINMRSGANPELTEAAERRLQKLKEEAESNE